MIEATTNDVSINYTYDSGGLRTGKTVTTVEYVKNGLVHEDNVIRYYEDGVAIYAGLVAVDGHSYYISSAKHAITGQNYDISKTNDLLPAGNYYFDVDGKMEIPYPPATNEDGSVKNGLYTDEEDGQIRYYVNGYASYAGLVYVEGSYYYINSSRTGVKNCSYYVTKHNDLLPADTYTFDADGRMTNPPANASTYALEREAEATSTPLATIVTDYDYVYIGSQLAQMVISTSRNGGTATEEVLNFAYDASGMPATVSYDGVTYYYITNLQGDVLAIVDGHGATLVEYEYDPYGRLRSMTGVMSTTLGEANPLRYRGYVYDSESRLYYLQSRYYDPKVGRFINADALASTGQGIVGYNMFAYCNNNPVIHSDHSGYFTDGQIHDEVLKEIAKRSGDRYKYKRQDTLIIYTVAWGLKWFGFCDLYDPVTGETWELKKNTPSPSCRTEYAERQLDNYINNGYLFAKADLKLKYPTTNIPSGFFTRTDESGTQYLINYWDQGGGILRYQYFVIPSNYDILAATIVAGVFCASLSIQQGGNARIRQQQFDR